jgi:hypothetical protein
MRLEYDENERAVCLKDIRSRQKILSISATLNNENAKVKVENSVNLILDYSLIVLYLSKFINKEM